MKVHINEADVVPFDDVADGVFGLNILFVNVYGIRSSEGGWVLVDAGLYFSADRIHRWAERHFGDVAPSCILLTHAHFDHVGSVKELADRWMAPVYAHNSELPYLLDEKSYPPPDPSVGGGLMARLSPFYPRGPIAMGGRIHPLPTNGSVPYLPDWVWLHTPGHTEGHVSYWRNADRTLIVGDCFCTAKQESLIGALSQSPVMSGPPAYYTPDWNSAQRSVERLSDLHPLFIAPGHGRPVAGTHGAELLRQLAVGFNEIVPEHVRSERARRERERAAETDEQVA